jgi:hypothetical protein
MIRMPLHAHIGDVDDEVAAFVEQQFWSHLGPYPSPEPARSAQQVLERALYEFGSKRCVGLEWYQH